MKGKSKKLIRKYQFEDDSILINVIIVCNLVLALLFFLFSLDKTYFDPRAQICLLTGLIFLVANKYYDWTSVKINVIAAIVYLIILLLEVLYWGLPNSAIKLNTNGYSKGFMMELILVCMPYVYIVIRSILIAPLINIILSAMRNKQL